MEKCLPADIADKLLVRLSEDDAFRDTFRRDPRQALAQLGYEPARQDADISAEVVHDVDGPWACLHGDGLPSKEEIQRMREKLQQELTASMSQKIFHVSLS
ncbi:NHLP-related RiPP peptide [Alkalisalibacterium limincola]|uniref:Modified peptide n=1 Tax=Alkalisalibacterium limincola TaxID=2699169 RepID=A0A5C8KN65_9GAMM|nr:NHLP-related RiPP peptide [Alkalisalibacterium limincola]TXK60784.1 putative modified peptide [Alkalisalibacterium limincola]